MDVTRIAAERYVDMRGDIFGFIRNTNLQLRCALNIDVTRVDPVQTRNLNPLDPAWSLCWRTSACMLGRIACIRTRRESRTNRPMVWIRWTFGYLDLGPAGNRCASIPSNNPNSWQPFLRRDPNDPTGLPSYVASGIALATGTVSDGRPKAMEPRAPAQWIVIPER